MNLICEQVEHKQYGEGKIIQQTETQITVEFSNQVGIKKFLYPIGFKSFLKLLNTTLQGKLDTQIFKIEEKATEERRVEESAAEEERLEEKKKRIELRRKAAKRALAKKIPKKEKA